MTTRVLLVDDDLELTAMLSQYLLREGEGGGLRITLRVPRATSGSGNA